MTVRELLEAYDGDFDKLVIYKGNGAKENLVFTKSCIVLPHEYWNKKVKSFYKDLPFDENGFVVERFVIVIKE